MEDVEKLSEIPDVLKLESIAQDGIDVVLVPSIRRLTKLSLTD
jgi:hypothetical protein